MRYDNNTHRGFTLLELLVVLAIVGVITATAVPHYAVYKRKAFDLRALSDLHNVALAEEAYFIEKEEYLACSDAACAELPGISTLSQGVVVSVALTEEGFRASASHPQGSGKTFVWDSALGGLVEAARHDDGGGR